MVRTFWRHVFADIAVTPGGGPDQEPLFVNEFDGQPVHFGLHGIGEILRPLQKTFDPLVEFPYLLPVEGVFQAQHGHRMGQGFKLFQGTSAHPLGG